MTDALHTLSEMMEALNASGAIDEGQYLTAMNALRDVHRAAPPAAAAGCVGCCCCGCGCGCC